MRLGTSSAHLIPEDTVLYQKDKKDENPLPHLIRYHQSQSQSAMMSEFESTGPYSILSDSDTQEITACPCQCPSYVIHHIWDWCSDLRHDIFAAANSLHGKMYVPTNPAMDLAESPIISTSIKFVVGHGLYLAVQMWMYREDQDGLGVVETLGQGWRLHNDVSFAQTS
jgi:hypothetical protein